VTEPKRVVIRHTATVINVGKTKARITLDGWANCGTEVATGWHVNRFITVDDGKRRRPVDVSICNACHEATGPGLF